MYKELLTVPQTPEFTARILSYEIGDIHKLMIYIERFGSAGYVGDLKIAHADALTMISLLGEQLGYDLEEQRNVGLGRFKDRMQECKDAEVAK